VGYTSYHRSNLNFDHDDVPEKYKYLVSVMESLEKGKTATFSPSIPFADVLWVDDYYAKQGLRMDRGRDPHNYRSVTARLIGLPDDLDENWSKRTFKTALKYVGAVLLGLLFCFMFFMALVL
jgi:hypothetical protein